MSTKRNGGQDSGKVYWSGYTNGTYSMIIIYLTSSSFSFWFPMVLYLEIKCGVH